MDELEISLLRSNEITVLVSTLHVSLKVESTVPSGPTVVAVTERPFSETWKVHYLSDRLPNAPAAFETFSQAWCSCAGDDLDGYLNAAVPQSTATGKPNGLLMAAVAKAWTEMLEY